MSRKFNRRETIGLLAAAPLAAGFSWTQEEVEHAHARTREARNSENEEGAPRFFTEHEYRTVQTLVDFILPADERSGSATEAGVHEFIDFMMLDQPGRQVPMRGGLAWIDLQCQRRFDRPFIECSQEQQQALLDEIAYPDEAAPEMSHGVAFFNSFRDLTATGFWTSRMGIEDLEFKGNQFVTEWVGCPQEALEHLDVRYDED